MKTYSFLVLMITGIVIIVADNLYDRIDVDTILGSERLSRQYANCLLDKGRCTADGRGLRRALPDIVRTNCESCSEQQKELARKFINHFQRVKPDIWMELRQKYDPEGKHLDEFSKL